MRVLIYLRDYLFAALAVCAMAGVASGQPIFIDDFEAGTPGTQIPANGTPWRVNTSGRPAFYQSTNNPFPAGNVYGYMHDDISDGTNGTRLMSTNVADTGMLEQFIAGQVTTFSFDFSEPADTGTTDQGGFGFGYTREDDLNSAEKNFRAVLLNGVLSPDSLVAGSGGPTNYALETVHTMFMLANDSPNPVTNYRGGQTLDPGAGRRLDFARRSGSCLCVFGEQSEPDDGSAGSGFPHIFRRYRRVADQQRAADAGGDIRSHDLSRCLYPRRRELRRRGRCRKRF